MSKVIKLDIETLATMINGRFVFAYDWVVSNYYNGISDFRLVEPMYNLATNREKIEMMNLIKDDFLSYQGLEDWVKLINELEKEYKNNLTD